MGKSPIKDTYAWKSALKDSGGKALAINATCGKVRKKIYLGNSTTKDTHGKSSLKNQVGNQLLVLYITKDACRRLNYIPYHTFDYERYSSCRIVKNKRYIQYGKVNFKRYICMGKLYYGMFYMEQFNIGARAKMFAKIFCPVWKIRWIV